jgi:leucyl aminopeptidase
MEVMAFPELSYTTDPLRETKADALVLALPPLDHDAGALDQWPGLASALNAVGFSGALGATVRAYAPEATSLPLIVVGTGPAPDTAALREAVGAALERRPASTPWPSRPRQSMRTGGEPSRRAPRSARTASTDTSRLPLPRARHTWSFVVSVPAASALARAQAVGAAAALVKDLVHTPAEWLGPQDVADAAREALAELPVDVVVLDEEQLAADGYGGILGVGQGSDRPPRLVRLDYAPRMPSATSPSSARASPSTPVGSRSSRPREWWA